MSKQLSERAMLASLTIRRWQAIITDKKATNQVATQNAIASRRAGKYRKNCIDIDAPSFKAICTASSDIRHKHYFYTLPWSQDGARILTCEMFDQYSRDMRALTVAFDRTVEAFEIDYPALRAAARTELNGLYNDQDYPSRIRSKFGIDLSIMPLPDAADFRAALSEDAVTDIKAGIERELESTVATAMREPFERLNSHIGRMVERLQDPKATFRDSLVTGLADLCAILPGLNLTSDPRLDDLRKQSEALIAGIDAQTLRDMPTVRADVAKRAAEIQDVMAAYMGATS